VEKISDIASHNSIFNKKRELAYASLAFLFFLLNSFSCVYKLFSIKQANSKPVSFQFKQILDKQIILISISI